jgi:hypothetical protein
VARTHDLVATDRAFAVGHPLWVLRGASHSTHHRSQPSRHAAQPNLAWSRFSRAIPEQWPNPAWADVGASADWLEDEFARQAPSRETGPNRRDHCEGLAIARQRPDGSDLPKRPVHAQVDPLPHVQRVPPNHPSPVIVCSRRPSWSGGRVGRIARNRIHTSARPWAESGRPEATRRIEGHGRTGCAPPRPTPPRQRSRRASSASGASPPPTEGQGRTEGEERAPSRVHGEHQKSPQVPYLISMIRLPGGSG